MPAFPTLTRTLTPARYRVRPVGGVVQSESDAGYVVSRSKYTGVKHVWDVHYEALVDADKDLLDTFYDTTLVNGSASFTWDDLEEDSQTVRIVPGSWLIQPWLVYNRWILTARFREV